MELGLGIYPVVSLKDARDQALDNRRMVSKGLHPAIEKRRRKAIPTLKDAALTVWDQLKRGWSDAGHARDWLSSLDRHVFGYLGHCPVTDVGKSDIAFVLQPIWTDQPKTARNIKQRLSAVMSWAVASDLRTDNPCDGIDIVLGSQGAKATVQHMRAVPYVDVGSVLDKVRASGKWIGAVLAFEFMVLTAARSGEVRGAKWSEVDLDAGVWTVPASRMKAKRSHRVPLSSRAVAVLGQARTLDSDLIFPSQTGKVLHDSILSRLMTQLGVDAVPHGFRSSFRDWATEQTDMADGVIEAALAHVDQNKTRAAYARSDVLDRRRSLMQAWADYLNNAPSPTMERS